MYSKTLGTLVTLCKERCDMENQDTPTSAQWKSWISMLYGDLHGEVAQSGLRYFETTTVIVTDGVDGSYALASNHLTTVGVDYLIAGSGGRRRALVEQMVQERNVYSSVTGESYAYALSGQNLVLYPTPPAGQSYEHIWIAQPTDLATGADGDSVDVVCAAGLQFLVEGVAVKALAREEAGSERLAVEERERARERLQYWASLRSLNQPRRMVTGPDPYWLEQGDAADWVR